MRIFRYEGLKNHVSKGYVVDIVYLAVGVFCAGVGGELFVRGTVGIATWARIPPGIVGATIAAFATSSPELSVAVRSALAGTPQIALGDSLGSNVVNVALILAIAILITTIPASRDCLKRDLPVAVFVPLLTSLLFLDGVLSRFDAFVLQCVFFMWLWATIFEANSRRSGIELSEAKPNGHGIAVLCIVGLGILILAGNLIVLGASGIARSLGIAEFVIGATIVAVGTSVPELATTLIAVLRGHNEVGVGTVLGSNIFNGLFIVSSAAFIHPIHVGWSEIAIVLGFGVLVLIPLIPFGITNFSRRRGALLLIMYATYVGILLLAG